MLSQAILDAQQLKEAIKRNAEQMLIEQHSGELKKLVEGLLDDDGADLGSVDDQSFTDQIPLAATDNTNLCPCQKTDEEVEIDFDQLVKMAEEEPGDSSELRDRNELSDQLISDDDDYMEEPMMSHADRLYEEFDSHSIDSLMSDQIMTDESGQPVFVGDTIFFTTPNSDQYEGKIVKYNQELDMVKIELAPGYGSKYVKGYVEHMQDVQKLDSPLTEQLDQSLRNDMLAEDENLFDPYFDESPVKPLKDPMIDPLNPSDDMNPEMEDYNFDDMGGEVADELTGTGKDPDSFIDDMHYEDDEYDNAMESLEYGSDDPLDRYQVEGGRHFPSDDLLENDVFNIGLDNDLMDTLPTEDYSQELDPEGEDAMSFADPIGSNDRNLRSGMQFGDDFGIGDDLDTIDFYDDSADLYGKETYGKQRDSMGKSGLMNKFDRKYGNRDVTDDDGLFEEFNPSVDEVNMYKNRNKKRYVKENEIDPVPTPEPTEDYHKYFNGNEDVANEDDGRELLHDEEVLEERSDWQPDETDYDVDRRQYKKSYSRANDTANRYRAGKEDERDAAKADKIRNRKWPEGHWPKKKPINEYDDDEFQLDDIVDDDAAKVVAGNRRRGKVDNDPMSQLDFDDDSFIKSLVGKDQSLGIDDLNEDVIKNAIREALKVDLKHQPSGWRGANPLEYKDNENFELSAENDTFDQDEDLELKHDQRRFKNIREPEKKVDKTQIELNKAKESIKSTQNELNEMKKKYNELYSIAQQLKETVEIVNTNNAKLLYTNKVLNSSSLNERQKQNIAEGINNSQSIDEAKMIFETLQGAVGDRVNKFDKLESLNEAISRKGNSLFAKGKQGKVESPTMNRMQVLAGLKKK